jgi:tetratricopeptide (TPR) repeat protein
MIDRYSAENREDEGLIVIAYSLCPNLAFPLEHGLSIGSLEEMFTVLDTDPEAILPFLRDERRGFYAYLEVSGLGEHGRKVKEIVSATTGDIRAVSRIIATFQSNVIKPFQDGINNELQLVSLEDLYNLPDYLKERTMIFIERNYGLLPAWIENITGKKIDPWFQLLSKQRERIARWGTWEYFVLFMYGFDSYDKIQKNGDYFLYEKDGKKGLFHITAQTDRAELLYGVETGVNRLTLKKQDGGAVFSGTYAANLADGYDRNGVSVLQFIDAEGRMAVFDSSRLYYFNLNSGEKEPRYELKDGEIDLLAALGSAVPFMDIAASFKEKNNCTDMNKLIDASWQKFGEEKKYKTERDLLLLIDKENMEGLPRSFDFYLSEIGVTFFLEKSYQDAFSFSEQALALNSSGLNSHGHSYNFDCARCLYFIGTTENWNTAIGYLDKAMQVTPEKRQPVAWKGYCLEKTGKYNEAIACLNMALDWKTNTLTNEEKGHVFAARASCYNALGMKDKADRDSAESDRLLKLPKSTGSDYLNAV